MIQLMLILEVAITPACLFHGRVWHIIAKAQYSR